MEVLVPRRHCEKKWWVGLKQNQEGRREDTGPYKILKPVFMYWISYHRPPHPEEIKLLFSLSLQLVLGFSFFFKICVRG